jgi:hypothetical protein
LKLIRIARGYHGAIGSEQFLHSSCVHKMTCCLFARNSKATRGFGLCTI